MIHTVTDLKSTFSPERHALFSNYLPVLVEVLNEFHGVNYSIRFWSFILSDYIQGYITKQAGVENKSNAIKKTDLWKKKLIHTFKVLFKRSKSHEVYNVIKNHNSLHIGFPKLSEVDDDLGKALPYYMWDLKVRFKKETRERLLEICSLYDSNLSNLINGIPAELLEGFETVFNRIPLFNPTEKIFHYHLGSNFHKWVLAKYTENGAKLFWYQHGAYYGEMNYGVHVSERKLADVYRTWGWKLDEKDEPWKAYRLIKFKERFDSISVTSATSGILIPLTGLRPQAIKKQNAPVLDYLEANLDMDHYKLLLARPRPTNKVFSRKSSFKNVVPSCFTLTSGLKRIQEEMKQVSVVITPVIPATIFLECIHVDFPIVGLLTNDQPTEIIKPFYDFFLEQQVLHITIESLVTHLNTVDIASWWERIIAMPPYLQFKATFANTY
ncbi:MAG: hypothetical protein Q8K02_00105 [Flavobacterium sp.]|nr:hypothetical protein [Flavobacterium sp.]